MKYLSLFILTTALTACSTLGNAPAPTQPEANIPFTTSLPTSEKQIQPNWWALFQSPELTSLITKALESNTDLAASTERVQQARLQARITAANAVPTLGASAGAGRTLTDSNGDTTGRNSLSAGASLSYEADLFGRLAANRLSARRSAEAAVYDNAALTNLTTVTVAQTYFQALTLAERTTLAEENLKLSEEVLKLLEIRFNAGAISGLEIAQQRGSVASTRSTLTTLKQQYATTLTSLAVLVGEAPQSFTLNRNTLASITLPTVPINQPSQVITQRPDVLAAESRLQAAGANITAARAALFPSLNLGAGSTFAFDPVANTLSLSANLLAPIFNGGNLRNQLTVTKSRREELAQTYRGTVLTALKETQDALTATTSSAERLTYTQTARQQAATAYTLSRTRLQNGLIDMPTLLASQQSDLSSADSLAQSRLENLTAATNLILALGGGWQP